MILIIKKMFSVLIIYFHLTRVKCKLEAEMLNWYPLVSVFSHFLSDQECDMIIEETKKHPKYMASSSDQSISVYFDEYPRLSEPLKDIGKLL